VLLTCADIGMGEPRGSGPWHCWRSDLESSQVHHRTTNACRAVPRLSGTKGALMTRTACGSAPRSMLMRISLLRSCRQVSWRHRCPSTATWWSSESPADHLL